MTLNFPFIMSQRDRRDITIKEIEFEAEREGHTAHIDSGLFSGQIQEVNGDDTANPEAFRVAGHHVHNWVISGQLSNVNGHVDAPATPDNNMEIGGV